MTETPVAATAAAARQPAKPPSLTPEERQRQRATIDVGRFASLVLQLGLALIAIWGLNLEDVRFQRLATWCFAGFVVHYLTPWRFKKFVFIALSLAGGYFVLATPEGQVQVGLRAVIFPLSCVVFVVVVGLLFYVILRMRARFLWRVLLILGVAGALAVVRYYEITPDPYWQVLGAAFMFRLIVYTYDIRTAKAPEKLSDFMSYFFMLPVFYFVLFPVVDYTTFKKSYYADDIHKTAQRGVDRARRGASVSVPGDLSQRADRTGGCDEFSDAAAIRIPGVLAVSARVGMVSYHRGHAAPVRLQTAGDEP